MDVTAAARVAAFVVPSGVGVGWAGTTPPEEADAAAAEPRSQVAREIGPAAKPRHVIAVAELPKTRSGKIVRRLLAQPWQGEELGDVTSLQNQWAVEEIRAVLAEGVAERKAGR